MTSLTADVSGPAALPRHELRPIIAGVMLAMLLAALDQTVVGPALPTIGRELGDFHAIAWVVTAYLLSATAVTPIYGKLSDLYGRRELLLVGIALFAVGSLLCALAPSMLLLIAARALQGAGGGGLISLANTVVGDVISPRDRGRYQGYFASVFATASIAGPVLGGFLTQHLSWTMIFWINLPLSAVAALIVDRTLRRLGRRGARHSIDYLGSLLMVAATVAFLLALTWGGHRYAWVSLPILGLFAGALALALLFVWRQTVAREPVLPLTVLAHPIVRTAALVGLLVLLVYTSASIYVPLYLQLSRGFSADQAGLLLIPLMASVVGGALITGQYMRFRGGYKKVPIAGALAASAALFALGLAGNALPTGAMVLCLLVTGAGLGTTMPALLVATQNAVAPGDLGVATAMHTFFRSLGGAIGVAVLGALILGVLATRGAALAPAGGTGDLADLLRSGSDLAVRAAAGDAFAAFFKAVAGVTLLAVVGLVLLKEIPLRLTPGAAHHK
jgi:EmrB/QacA subfamily drug resistance transporter